MTDLKQGDIILVKTNHFVAKLLRFGQRSYGKEILYDELRAVRTYDPAELTPAYLAKELS